LGVFAEIMQENSALTQKIQGEAGFQGLHGRSGVFVAQSVWTGAIRALCLVFGLTIGWILLFDPAVLRGLAIYQPSQHPAQHL
jgi:hypothetical protein